MLRWRNAFLLGTTAVCTSILLFQYPTATEAEIVERPTLSFYGTPGLIDMPTATMQPDGQFSATASFRKDAWRSALTFQMTPRLSTTFQYSYTEDLLDPAITDENPDHYDRAFSFSYRFLNEGKYTPAMAVGITDIAGTGFFANEYIVATKHVHPALALSAGIGWGRLGSANSSTRTSDMDIASSTSSFNIDDWFTGPAAYFGGLNWRINDKWTFAAEYSSDNYDLESQNAGFERDSPFNFGLKYRTSPWFDLAFYSLYGSEFGIQGTVTLNPKSPPFPGGREEAPPPVSVRGGNTVNLAAWGLPSHQLQGAPVERLQAAVEKGFDDQGLELVSLDIDGSTAWVKLRNPRYDASPQAIGRASRVLAAILPDQVETFRLTLINAETPTATISIRRSDLEELEFNPDRDWKSYVRASVDDAYSALSFGNYAPPAYPNTNIRLKPYFAPVLFDPDDPFRWYAGAELEAGYTPSPGLILSTSYRLKLAGNRDESTRLSDSVLPHVRSDLPLYDKDGASHIRHLTAEYFYRPGPDLYGRVTAGYLERMFGGVSGEVLWKPVDSPIAYSAELNYVQQRDFEGGFGFQDYDVTMGHASVYYEIGNGYYGQVDAGRYLAGDWGSTVTFSRDFANGWRFGAFATLTDVSSEDFGEGSFDKGIFVNIPLSWLSGEPSRNGFATTIRPVTRDGGAQLQVRNRLYDVVKNDQEPTLRRRWGNFWR
ncbi:YjbH domain-containing protein [Tropicimonas isoalkanivorans]|uniref:Exopolysaccharide biosynthesis protein YbjH n=1 Tax=Tropicimonas isoalkanivorans TaxID=441112 RepID=A0A1I1ENA5_9RHOB|nr:YjbH domain-containing protein [Tropicimonas isoalkanivorans]SFB86400.1 Exopolysaccharide biosynthesis protein YbjH [Tropicimonas isoalkanivorans]